MKKEKIPNFFLFYIHKLYYFVSVILAVGIRSYITNNSGICEV